MTARKYVPLTVRVGNAGLGNRRPNTMGQLHSHSSGVVAKLSEHCILLEYQSVGYEQNHYNVPECPINSPVALRRFIGGDNAGIPELALYNSTTVTSR